MPWVLEKKVTPPLWIPYSVPFSRSLCLLSGYPSGYHKGLICCELFRYVLRPLLCSACQSALQIKSSPLACCCPKQNKPHFRLSTEQSGCETRPSNQAWLWAQHAYDMRSLKPWNTSHMHVPTILPRYGLCLVTHLVKPFFTIREIWSIKKT
jgi:hypothetical protein